MSKKDFKIFAELVKKLEAMHEEITAFGVERLIVEALENNNPDFSREKWLKFKNSLSR